MADLASLIYGSAQNAEQEQGQGLAQGIHQGAQLAIQQEQLGIQQQQMQMKMAQLQQAKFDKVIDMKQAQAQMPDGPSKQLYGKFIDEQAIPGMQMDKMFHPVAASMLSKDTGLSNFVIGGIRNGTIPPAIMGDPEQLAKVAQQAGYQATAEDASSLISNYPKEMQGAYSEWMNNQMALRGQQARGALATSYPKTVEDFTKQAEADLGKEMTEKKMFASGMDSRDRALSALAKDPSGGSVRPQDVGQMVFGLLHEQLGRVNQTELDSVLSLYGLSGKSQSYIAKHFTGGVPPDLVGRLADMLDSAAKNTDEEVSQKSQMLDNELTARTDLTPQQRKYLTNIKAPLTKPVFRARPGFKMVGGHQMSTQQAQDFVAKFPNDPMAAAVRQAFGLGGGSVAGGQ